MKRIVLIAAALTGMCGAGIGATVASAATTTKTVTVTETKVKRETKTVHARSTCKLSLTTTAPAGSTGVIPGTPSGDQYGSTYCSGLRTGVTREEFSTDASGDITGKIAHWFSGGSVNGTFSLTPSASSGPPTGTTFTSATDSGTVKLTGAGGLLKGTTGTGTLKCTTSDGIHDTCTESLKLVQTVTELVPVTVKVREKVTVG